MDVREGLSRFIVMSAIGCHQRPLAQNAMSIGKFYTL